jgi:hypothetical protein
MLVAEGVWPRRARMVSVGANGRSVREVGGCGEETGVLMRGVAGELLKGVAVELVKGVAGELL